MQTALDDVIGSFPGYLSVVERRLTMSPFAADAAIAREMSISVMERATEDRLHRNGLGSHR